MKVMLISPNARGGPTPIQPLFPPLSVMIVAALTPPDIEVEIVDESVRSIPYDTDADLIGVTCSTGTANAAYGISDRFRALGRPVVLGGIHVTALPDEASRHADAVVVGEAEGKWDRLIRDFQAGRMQSVYVSGERPAGEQIPVPARNLISRKDYRLPDTVQTSRGCPFACAFCTVSAFFGRTFRTRPVGSVVEEIENLSGDLFLFADDNIIGQPEYARELFRQMKPLKKRWLGQASVSMLKHPDVMKLAGESGCRGLFVGMETLSDSTLESIGKPMNRREDYGDVVSLLHDNGIGILGAFVFGFDEDDEGVFDRTLEFVERVRLDAVQFSILTPFPGTKIYGKFREQGRLIDTDWSHYDGSHVVYRPARLSPDALFSGFKRAYSQAYSYGAIFRRLGISLGKSVHWAVNLGFKRRVDPWLRRAA